MRERKHDEGPRQPRREAWSWQCWPWRRDQWLALLRRNRRVIRTMLALADELAAHSNTMLTKPVYMSRSTLAKAVGSDRDAVRKALSRLKALGYLSVEGRPFGARWRSNLYRFTFPEEASRRDGVVATPRVGCAETPPCAPTVGSAAPPEQIPIPDRSREQTAARRGTSLAARASLRVVVRSRVKKRPEDHAAAGFPVEIAAYLREVAGPGQRPDPRDAREWVASFGSARVRAAAEATAEQVRRGNARNPLAVLRAAVPSGYAPNERRSEPVRAAVQPRHAPKESRPEPDGRLASADEEGPVLLGAPLADALTLALRAKTPPGSK